MAPKAKPRRTRAKAENASARPGAPFYRPFADRLDRARRGARDAAEPARPAAPAKPAPVPPPPSRPSEATTDAESFAIYMAGVRELGPGHARIPRTASSLETKPARERTPDPDEDARARMRSLVVEGIRFEVTDDGETMGGRRLDVDPRELRRLRREAYTVDAKLDLHGMSAPEAHEAVDAFLKKHHASGDRVVLIVHGKGNHSPRGIGVLRGELAAWLSQGRAARDVAAFASLPDDHGGSGAVLVLLAR